MPCRELEKLEVLLRKRDVFVDIPSFPPRLIVTVITSRLPSYRSNSKRSSRVARLQLPFVTREIHTLRPKSSTEGRSDVGRVQYEGRINFPSKPGVTACALSEQEGITGHKYALTSMGLRGQVSPRRKKRKMIFY